MGICGVPGHRDPMEYGCQAVYHRGHASGLFHCAPLWGDRQLCFDGDKLFLCGSHRRNVCRHYDVCLYGSDHVQDGHHRKTDRDSQFPDRRNPRRTRLCGGCGQRSAGPSGWKFYRKRGHRGQFYHPLDEKLRLAERDGGHDHGGQRRLRTVLPRRLGHVPDAGHAPDRRSGDHRYILFYHADGGLVVRRLPADHRTVLCGASSHPAHPKRADRPAG